MRRTLAVIPFRGTPTAKSRLATRFSAGQRERIARHVFHHAVWEIAGSGAVDQVLVVTSDREPPVLPPELADRVAVLQQPTDRAGLNAAIELGRKAAVADGIARMLVVLPDLPLLDRDDIRHVLAEEAAVVLAPDRHGTGTNALAIDLHLEGFAFGFGEGSAAHHRAEANRLGVVPAMVTSIGIRHDLDTPEDWKALPAATREALSAVMDAPATVGCAGD